MSPRSLAAGLSACSQPLDRSGVAGVFVAAGVAALSLSEGLSEPHPAASKAREAIRTARCRGTAGKDNGRRVPLSPAVRPYDHVLLDLDATVWLGAAPPSGQTVEVVSAWTGPSGWAAPPCRGGSGASAGRAERGKGAASSPKACG